MMNAEVRGKEEGGVWLEFSVESRLLKRGVEQKLRVEANELIAIFTQSQRTARSNLGRE
jgi:hypothetical protein